MAGDLVVKSGAGGERGEEPDAAAREGPERLEIFDSLRALFSALLLLEGVAALRAYLRSEIKLSELNNELKNELFFRFQKFQGSWQQILQISIVFSIF